MKTLKFEKMRIGWQLTLGGRVLSQRFTPTARGDVLLISAGVIYGLEDAGIIFQVDPPLAFALKERGLWQEKAPYTA